MTSSVTSASLAQTASYINVTGSNISVNWFGSQLQLTASAGASAGVAFQTAQSGTLFDVTRTFQTAAPTTRSIGGAFEAGDIYLQQYLQINGVIPGGGFTATPGTGSNFAIYTYVTTASVSASVSTGLPTTYNSSEGYQFVPLATQNSAVFTFFKAPALSVAESAGPLMFAPSGSGAYYSGSGFVHTGSIYYAADLQRYRILKNKSIGWEDLVPTGSAPTSAFPYTGSAKITGSLGVTGSIAATGPVYIGQNWRMQEVGANLVIEKWNGSAWIQTDIFS